MKLLFICTHNRCRSILAEAITRHLANSRIVAASAGSDPANQVHPLSIKYLNERGICTQGLVSQSWDEFTDFAPDAVITLCDSAAEESCPDWFGNSVRIHWGLEDPSRISGEENELRSAFNNTINIIEERIERLLELDLVDLSGPELQGVLTDIASSVAEP